MTKGENIRISKEEYYVNIALAVSKRSTCLKRHYGCVIVKDDVIIATGYNGSPRGEENCCDKGSCHRMNIPHNSGDYSGCPAVHAEQNAMLQASRDLLLGSIVYMAGEEYAMSEVWEDMSWDEVKDCGPCPICLAMMKNAGIIMVINRNGVQICL